MDGPSMAKSPFKVGYAEYEWFDRERKAWSGSRPRPLDTAVWYPASPNSLAPLPEPGAAGGALFMFDNAVEGDDLAADYDRYPVVLVSHGTGGAAQSLSWLGARFARAGYVVIGVNHHGNTASEPYVAEGFACWWERARDLTIALNQLAQDQKFSYRLNLDRVFAAGFSLGGHTVLALAGAITDMTLFNAWNADRDSSGLREFPDLDNKIEGLMATSSEFRRSLKRQGDSLKDSRIKAVIALAPVPPVRGFTLESLSRIEIPVGMMVGGSDSEAPHADCACWLHNHIPNSELVIMGDSVGHYVFLPEATELGKLEEPDICVDADDVDRRSIHDQATASAIEVFERVGAAMG